jgi:hypothetical protein
MATRFLYRSSCVLPVKLVASRDFAGLVSALFGHTFCLQNLEPNNCPISRKARKQNPAPVNRQVLENQFPSKPPLTLAATPAKTGIGGYERRSNCAEIRLADINVRIIKVRRVGHSERIRLKLEGKSFGDFKVPHQAHVEIEISRSAQDIAACIAKKAVQKPGSARRHLLEC